MKEIPLTKGKVALVDDEDYEALNRVKWQARHSSKGANSSWHARRGIRRGGKLTTIYMHRQILGVLHLSHRECMVDHENNNGLDNRRINLRLITMSENGFNRQLSQNNSSGYKGVHFKGRWAAAIQFQKKKFHLGYFDTPEDAARAYDKAAREKYGQYARTNFN